jgi:NTE family protein
VTIAVVAETLGGVPLFAALSPSQLDTLARAASTQRLAAGEWLFHEGDAGDSLFVVAAGAVDAVAEGPPPATLVRTLGRGQCIGELALLTGEPRSLGARARRDSELLRIGRTEFESLLLAEAGFGLALTRVLGDRLRSNRAPVDGSVAPPRLVGLVPLHDGAPVAAVADALTSAFATLGPVARLDPAEPLSLETLDRLESSNDRVLLVATVFDTADAWTAYCLRQADVVVGVASRGRSAADAPVASALRGCDVAFVADAGVEPDLEAWMGALEPRTTYIVRVGSPVGAERMARRLAGRALGVVLSGGGARGFAHLGVVDELQREGYVIDRLGGASIGAIVGSLFAEGYSADEAAAIMDAEYVRTSPLKGRTIPLVALSRGERGFAAQHRLHGERRIEGLDVNFFCVSADLAAQRQVVHRRGLVAIAVSASQALPAFVPPVQDGDRLLVDGAVLNNLPVQPMLDTGEGPIIAVDISGELPRPRPPRSRMPFLRRWIVGPAAEWAPPITETVLRSILLGNALTDAIARERADAVIRPVLRGVSTMRFRDLEGVRALGRDAARAAIDDGDLAALPIHRR